MLYLEFLYSSTRFIYIIYKLIFFTKMKRTKIYNYIPITLII